MKKQSILLIMTLLITGCTSATKVNTPGFVAPCDQIKLAESAEKSVLLPCLDGSGEINFHQLKGPLVINVWGSWCEGCKQEMPYFVELYQNPVFKSGQIQMLGVNVEEKSKEDAIEYIQKSGMSWPNLVDTSGLSKSIFGPGVPVTWFIDKEGKSVATKIGAYTNKQQLFDQFEKAFWSEVMNYFDFIVIGVLLVAFYSGYKNGLIKTIFRSVGYIAGGVFGLAVAVNYLSTWQNQLHKVVLALLAILLGATLGEYLLGKVATIFRVALFLPPFKFIDSLLGAGLSVLRASFILYLLATLLVFSTWSVADEYIKPAKFYTYADSHLPSAMSEIKSEIIKLLEKVN